MAADGCLDHRAGGLDALAALPGQLRLDTARALAEPRIRAMQAFLIAVEQESQVALF